MYSQGYSDLEEFKSLVCIIAESVRQHMSE